jgi:hypothetical protein
MSFIETEFIHYKRTKLMVYENRRVDIIGTESWLNLLNGRSFKIREGTQTFTNRFRWIWLAQSLDGIYWSVVLSW